MIDYIKIGDAENLATRGRLSHSLQIASMGRIYEVPYIIKLIEIICSINKEIILTSKFIKNIDIDTKIRMIIEMISKVSKQIEINTKII